MLRTLLLTLAITACGPTNPDDSGLKGPATVQSGTQTTITLNPADNLKGHAEIIKARAAYLTAMGKYQVDLSQAELNRAKAAQEWQLARALYLKVERLNLELRRLRQDEMKMRKKAERIEARATIANQMFIGKISRKHIVALRYIIVQAASAETNLAAMTTAIPAMPATEFRSSTGEEVSVEFAGGNAGQLFAMIHDQNLETVSYGAASVALLQAVSKLTAAAQKEAEEINEKMAALSQQNLTQVSP